MGGGGEFLWEPIWGKLQNEGLLFQGRGLVLGCGARVGPEKGREFGFSKGRNLGSFSSTNGTFFGRDKLGGKFGGKGEDWGGEGSVGKGVEQIYEGRLGDGEGFVCCCIQAIVFFENGNSSFIK